MTTESFIGERVRELRKGRRITQQGLAAVLGITQGHLSQLERGKGAFTAGQLLILLRHFNVTLDEFAPGKAGAGAEIQNALARQGARQLVEDENSLPSERLKSAAAAIREALVSADSARQIAAVAPVLVNNAGQLNLARLRTELAELGLENRFNWAVESTLRAIELDSNEALPADWRRKYRRAALIIETFFQPAPTAGPTEDPTIPPRYDVLDAEITTQEGLAEVLAGLPPIARRWRIATRIAVDDFVRALHGARAAV